MIKSFTYKETQEIFETGRSSRIPQDLWRRVERKLIVIHAAHDINDLSIPPSNRLEKLAGDRQGQYSIRVNDQWRICFFWDGEHAHEVELVDYH